MLDLREIIKRVETTVAEHRLDRGGYSRYTLEDSGEQGRRESNPYGCADAANILYTIGLLPREPEESYAMAESIRRFQDRDSGLFVESTHHPFHTTAHCTAALELFNMFPIHPLNELLPLTRIPSMEKFLESLDWKGRPWSESHKGAGLYVSLSLTGDVSDEWEDRYFEWLWNNTDSETGLLRRGCIGNLPAGGSESIFPHLAGTFHYLFNIEFARRRLRYPERLVATCLEIRRNNAFPLGESVGFAEVDWVYCLNRAVRQSGRFFDDAKKALAEFADGYVEFLYSLPPDDAGFDDLHSLFGAVCCLAELQQALPGLLRTSRPLRLVLDRRPFI